MMDPKEYDLLIVGAGPVGCTVAERAATILGWKSLIIDKRDHIGGNCHDCVNEAGQLIHKYGPHYFRTNYEDVFEYLSKFTNWIPGDYVVKSFVNNKLYPFPINLSTLQEYFGLKLDKDKAKELLNSLSVPNTKPRNSEEFILSRLGRKLYNDFYLGYTLKQWDIHPKDLDPSVCGRVPIRLNHDDSYVDAIHKVMPANGYTQMFSNMLRNNKITFLPKTDFKTNELAFKPKVATIYTGPVDEYFEYSLGKLPWRSLEFKWKTEKREFIQKCVQINYPNEHEYTRSVEIKHVTKQKLDSSTISLEFPQSKGDPYYPIPQNSSSLLYKEYKKLTTEAYARDKVIFVGRLAEYTYINTDEAIKKGLDTFERIKKEHTKL